jgi:predicted lipoprotein
MKKIISYTICLLTLFLFACGGDESDDTTLDYNQTAFLTNVGENIITPRYESLQSKLNDLSTKANTFSTSPSTTNLQTLKSAFLDTYKQFQYCVVFDFGPAGGSKNLNDINIYPVNTTTINSNISSGSYNFDAANQLDAQGFPAIDFLLYHSDENTIVSEFADTKRQKFLTDVISDIQTLVNEVTNSWQTSYTTTFIGATGTDAGSSLGLLINQFNFTFEDIKNFKIGTPSGSRNALEVTYPDKVEAYYSEYSLTLAQANLTSLEELYKGISTTGINDEGLDDYLQGLDQSTLDGTIQSKFTELQDVLTNLESVQSGTLSKIVENDNQKMKDAFDSFSAVVPSLKSELPSILGVAITYQDGDGD